MKNKTLSVSLLAILVILVGLAAGLDWWRGSRSEEPSGVSSEDWPGVQLPSLALESRPVEDQPFNILVLGLNHPRNGSSKSYVYDVAMVVHVDESLNKVAVLSIPRDTYLDIAGYGKRTLDAVYGLGGVPLVTKVVEDITGMRMRNYLVLKQEQFAWLVDLAGGVEYTLQEDISDTRWGTLKAGATQLDGTGALLVIVSPNYAGGELQRIQVRHAFLIALANQAHRMAGQPGFAWLLNLTMSELQTDLSLETFIQLAQEFGTWPVVDVSAGIAPGSSGKISGVSVYLLDPAKLKEMARSIEASATIP
jgi:polyisoprenyl-teichoic acid--peptidoglycan teichoic acid transferase